MQRGASDALEMAPRLKGVSVTCAAAVLACLCGVTARADDLDSFVASRVQTTSGTSSSTGAGSTARSSHNARTAAAAASRAKGQQQPLRGGSGEEEQDTLHHDRRQPVTFVRAFDRAIPPALLPRLLKDAEVQQRFSAASVGLKYNKKVTHWYGATEHAETTRVSERAQQLVSMINVKECVDIQVPAGPSTFKLAHALNAWLTHSLDCSFHRSLCPKLTHSRDRSPTHFLLRAYSIAHLMTSA